EPVARGTTNAYGLAAMTVEERHPDAVMVAMASDHVVRGRAAVTKAVRAALRAAESTDSIVLFGLKPTFPSTGLGYIHAPRLVPAEVDWADIGNWSELGDRVHDDAHGNSVEGEAVLVDTTGSLVFGDRRLVAAIGVKDMIIVDTEDAVLVVPRSRAQDVRKVVEVLKRARKIRYL